MSYFGMPKSDVSRHAFIEQALNTGTSDRDRGQQYLSDETLAALQQFAPQYMSAYEATGVTLARRIAAVEQVNVQMEQLKLYVRGVWQQIEWRVRAGLQPEATLRYYQLPVNGKRPNPRSRPEWLTLTAAIISGDAEAVAAGYAPVQIPAATDLQTVLAAAQPQVTAMAAADRAYDEAQAALAALRPQADELIRDVMDELRFVLRKRPAASQRRIMRTYGAQFYLRPGEIAEAGDLLLEEELSDLVPEEMVLAGESGLNEFATVGDTAVTEGLVLAPVNGSAYN